jgi:hypothetical protein
MSYKQHRENLLGRIDRYAEHSSAATLRKAAEACLNVDERFATERAEIDKNDHLTADGKRARLVDSLKAKHARDLRDARKPLDDAEKNIKAMRDRIKPAVIDRTDLVGAWERTELRSYVASLPDGAKTGLLLMAC